MNHFNVVFFLTVFLAYTSVPSIVSLFEADIHAVAIIEEENTKDNLKLKELKVVEETYNFSFLDLLEYNTFVFAYLRSFSSIITGPASPPPKLS